MFLTYYHDWAIKLHVFSYRSTGSSPPIRSHISVLPLSYRPPALPLPPPQSSHTHHDTENSTTNTIHSSRTFHHLPSPFHNSPHPIPRSMWPRFPPDSPITNRTSWVLRDSSSKATAITPNPITFPSVLPRSIYALQIITRLSLYPEVDELLIEKHDQGRSFKSSPRMSHIGTA